MEIDCLFADIFPNDIVLLIGCNARAESVARALGVDKRCIYCDYEHSLIIVNLVEEMALRLSLDVQKKYKEWLEDD